MYLWLTGVASWWHSPDYVGFLFGCVHHPVFFVFLLGRFPSPHSILIWISSSGRLHHYRGLATSGQYAQNPPVLFLGTPLLFYSPLGDNNHREITMDLWTACLCSSCLGHDVFITLFITLLLEELLVLINALAQLSMYFSRSSPMDLIWFLDRWHMSKVLLNSDYSSLWLNNDSSTMFVLR